MGPVPPIARSDGPFCVVRWRGGGPISRVLSRTTIYLGRRIAARLFSGNPGAGRAGPSHPYLPFLRMGLAKPRRCRRAGALLPHRFSFSRALRAGVFFSVALSVGLPRPAVSRHPALWSPDFPHRGIAPSAAVRPALARGGILSDFANICHEANGYVRVYANAPFPLSAVGGCICA